jgi:phosphoribosyl 1,2-cyclic phosphodiesterase
MGLRFASLGSGSSGNATIVCDGSSAILIDCGFTYKETCRRLAVLHTQPEYLKAVLVTHEHGDHAKGVATLAKKLDIPIYCSRGTAYAAGFDLERVCFIQANDAFSVNGFSVSAVTVPHDAREPLQFTVNSKGAKLGVLTDLGAITQAVIDAYHACDALLVEANHDVHMLALGPYPPSLQRRVASDWGHLNNNQTARLLESLDLSRVQHLIVGHISEKNNCLEKVRDALLPLVSAGLPLQFASQEQSLDWLVVKS